MNRRVSHLLTHTHIYRAFIQNSSASCRVHRGLSNCYYPTLILCRCSSASPRGSVGCYQQPGDARIALECASLSGDASSNHMITSYGASVKHLSPSRANRRYRVHQACRYISYSSPALPPSWSLAPPTFDTNAASARKRDCTVICAIIIYICTTVNAVNGVIAAICLSLMAR